MSESLKEMIAKIKAQNSQSINPPEKTVAKKSVEIVDDDDMDDDVLEDEVEEIPEQKAKPIKQETKQEMSNEEKLAMEMELLHNDGRYRVEMLNQMQEISNALKVIAGVLIELSGNGKGKD
jgi:hypothetical protein